MPLNTAWTPLRGWLRDGQSLPELSSVELLISLAQYDQVNEEHLLITTWSEPLTASDLTELTIVSASLQKLRSWQTMLQNQTTKSLVKQSTFSFSSINPIYLYTSIHFLVICWFLPRCIECRRGLAMRILSVRLSNACIVTKRKKELSRFLYHTKDHLA